YIWQGLLSLHAATNASGLLFISGVSAADNKSIENYETAYYIMTLKVLNGTSVICTKSWEQTYGEQTMVEGKLFENLGLKDCSNIYRLGLLGEACGVTSVYTYFAFNENELFALPGKQLVGDAGIYYYEETLLFPSEHKGSNQLLIKNIEEGSNESET